MSTARDNPCCFDLSMEALTGQQMLDLFRSRKRKVVKYADRLIEREGILDHLNNFALFRASDLKEQAKAADACYEVGKPRPLEGLFVGIKDNIAVEGQPCAGACMAFEGHTLEKSSSVVRRLLASGAILAGRTNMHELAYGMTSKNERIGYVHNYWNFEYGCWGSSAGSANAVAADLFPAALGTDTCGSIRMPAAACGVFGYRPSLNAWPNDFGLKICARRDVVGPIAGDMETICLLNKCVTGVGLDGTLAPGSVRIGIPKAYFWTDVDPIIIRGCMEFVERLRDLGFACVEAEGPDPALLLEAQNGFITNVNKEVFPRMTEFIKEHDFDNIKDIEKDVLPNIASQDVREEFTELWNHPVSDAEYEKTLEQSSQVVAALEGYASEQSLDCWLFPTMKLPAQRLTCGDTVSHLGRDWHIHDIGLRNVGIAPIANQPGISMPCGRCRKTGVPFGIEVDGLTGSDEKVLSIALAMERAGVFA